MSASPTDRDLLRTVRDRLDDWLYEARTEAFTELFEGDDAVLSAAELARLDRIDSALSREQGEGLWNSDQYGIVATGALDEATTPQVVCTAHPQLPEYAYPGSDSLDTETQRRLNDALWTYSERIVELAQHRLETFVWSADPEAGSE